MRKFSCFSYSICRFLNLRRNVNAIHNICRLYFLYKIYYYYDYYFQRFFIQSNYFSIYLQTHPHTINSCQAKQATHVIFVWHMKMHIISFAHTHTQTHTHLYVFTLTYTYSHTHTRTFSIFISSTHTQTHTHKYLYALSLIHTSILNLSLHKHIHIHFLSHSHTLSLSLTYTHTHTNVHYILYLPFFLIHWCMTFDLVVYLFNQIPKFISIVNVTNRIKGWNILLSFTLKCDFFSFPIFIFRFKNWN